MSVRYPSRRAEVAWWLRVAAAVAVLPVTVPLDFARHVCGKPTNDKVCPGSIPDWLPVEAAPRWRNRACPGEEGECPIRFAENEHARFVSHWRDFHAEEKAP